MERRESASFVAGAVILTIGAALLVDRIGLLPWTSAWSVWPLLLIAFGVANLVGSPHRGAAGLFLIALGAWIWAVEGGVVNFNTWPALIVVLGLGVMWQAWAGGDAAAPAPARGDRSPLVVLAVIAAIAAATTIDARHYALKADPGGNVHVFSALGAHQSHVAGDVPFTGGQLVAVMGQSVLDLRNAKAPDTGEMTVDVGAFWGNALVRVPPDWKLDVRTVPVLGAVIDERGNPETTDKNARKARRVRDFGLDWRWNSGAAGDADSHAAAPSAAPAAAATGSSGTASAGGTLVLTGSVVMASLEIR